MNSKFSRHVVLKYDVLVQGYTGKMYLDQGWLTQQTSDTVFWRLTATFQNEVKEFKGSDIIYYDYTMTLKGVGWGSICICKGLGRRHHQPQPCQWKQVCQQRYQC